MEFHKNIRLSKGVYEVPFQLCSITISTVARQPIFSKTEFTKGCIEILKEYAQKYDIKCHVFCFMPDHIHLLAEATPTKSLIVIVQELKGLWTRAAWQYRFHGAVFQKSFFDHFLRKDEDIMTVVKYILNNPVRAKIVERWQEYQFLGSTVYNLNEL
ncbi:MAG: transposase [bacterium]|nr:transposase [bacterium]